MLRSQKEHDMASKTSTTKAIHKKTRTADAWYTEEVAANAGRRDAEADIACGRRNRALLQQGQYFCLPAWDSSYSEAYRAAWQTNG